MWLEENILGARSCREASRELRLRAEAGEPRQPTSQAAFQSSAWVFQNLLGKAPLSSLPTPLPHLAPEGQPQSHNYESHARMLIAVSDLPSDNKRISLPN